MRTKNPGRTGFAVLVCLLVSFGGAFAAAQEAAKAGPAKASWTAEDILLAESASDWEISSDGKWAVWTKTRMDKEKNGRVSNLFLTNLDTKKEVQLTRGTESNGQPKWSPNGEWILFLSTKPLPKPNPDLSRSQLWRMSPFGGEPWPLTEFARGIQGYEWVDDDTVIFSAQEDAAFYEQELKRKKDSTRVVDDVGHEPPVRLFKLTIKDKKVARLTDNTDFIQSWAVTPDGKRAMTVDGQYLSFEWDHKILPKVFLCDLEKGTSKEILAGKRLVPLGIRAAPDGSGFYFAAPYSSDPRFFTASVTLLYFYDLAAGKEVKVDIGWENGLGGGLETTPDGFVTLLAAGARFIPARYVKSGPAWKRTDLEGEHVKNLFGFAVSHDAKVMVYDHSTPSTPTQWYRAALAGDKLTSPVRLTDLNPEFKDKAIARTEIVRWKGALGEEIDGLLYYPRDYAAGKKYPLLTAPHGGPAGVDLDAWDESWAYAHQLLSQRGAFILKPNYHGSSNYGLKFVESICCGKYYEYPVADIETGVDFLVGKGLVDPDRVGTFGWSNGSILSIAVSIANPDRYKVVCAGAGDVEFISDWANVDFGQSFDAYYLGKSPLEDPELYLRISPLFQMDKVKAPTIIFFGTEDRNVPTSQGWTHYRALYHLGKVPVKFLLFPGEPHTLQEYAHQLRKLEEEMAWFDRWFFKAEKAENEAFKKDSPFGQAIRRKGIAKAGLLYGIQSGAGKTLVPEVVKRGDLEVGRFEVTRAQYAAFDPKYKTAPGTENYPATGISFDQAKAYTAWLSKITGQAWRVPNEDEAAKLYEGLTGENTLDYWAGYALNPDDARRLEAKIKELGGAAALLKEAGSFAGVGKDDEELVFDLGGNAAEWVTAKDGSGKTAGGSADRPADPKARARAASAACTGFRVVQK
ncbi:MAG: prolyl oligopeptidase family serine peptidase [Candidatus Aminicenantes bacterium]|nr:prolyl oligopeptidase family serine peptidase [Candidatus Aminicenantes bacterium]